MARAEHSSSGFTPSSFMEESSGYYCIFPLMDRSDSNNDEAVSLRAFSFSKETDDEIVAV